VEELTTHSILHLATSCPRLADIKLENCSFVVDTVNPLTEEQLEVINGSVPLLLDLQALRIVNKMPLEMMLMVLRKALNIVTIDMDSMETLTDSTVLQLLQVNRLGRLQTLSVMATKSLTLQTVHTLMDCCPDFCRVRGLENWQAVPWQEVVDLWNYLRVSNIDLDAGEMEWQKEQEKDRERQEAAMKKMKDLPKDVKSKLGARFQEGQGLREDMDRHLLANPFPEEGEGHRPV